MTEDLGKLFFGRGKIMDWKSEYKDRTLRAINEGMDISDKLIDGMFKLVDCCFDAYYRLSDYFRFCEIYTRKRKQA